MTDTIDTDERYPEHAKRDKTQAIHDFLEWLDEGHKLHPEEEPVHVELAYRPERGGDFTMFTLSTSQRDDLMARWAGIDMKVIHQEKQAMLDEMRALHEKPEPEPSPPEPSVSHEPQGERLDDHYGYAGTGSLRSKTHIAAHEVYNVFAICGVGLAHGGVTDYRPSQKSLNENLCPKCKREAKLLGIDPMMLGYREGVDGE